MIMNNNLQDILDEYSKNPKDIGLNIKVANKYFELGHYSSCITFCLRVAEYCNDDEIVYESLCTVSECYARLGNRREHVKVPALHAINLIENKSQAYYYNSYICELRNEHFYAYTFASLGCNHIDTFQDFKYFPNIIKPKNLVFNKAVNAYWYNRMNESKELFISLYEDYDLDDGEIELIKGNLLKSFNFDVANQELKTFHDLKTYDIKNHKFLINKYNGSEEISKNYSQVYQDFFILTVLDGLKGGTYLEIGSADWIHGSNTYLLETNFDWVGTSIDIQKSYATSFNKERKNKCILGDATKLDLKEICSDIANKNVIDYLQVDCDPANISFEVLKRIPFDTYEFKVITFEHDSYADVTKTVRRDSRKYLESLGYELIVGNVSADENCPFEDWWVNKKLVDTSKLKKIVDKNHFNIEEYFFKNKKIPVISTAVVDETTLVERLINSVDYPTENFFIVNNSGNDFVYEKLKRIASKKHDYIDKITVCNLPSNIGWVGCLNLTIKSFLNAEYWIMSCDDLCFKNGFLQEMVTKSQNEEIGVVTGGEGHKNYQNVSLGTWSVFLVKDMVIDKIGLFDDNLYPAYCEDIDIILNLEYHNIKRDFVSDSMWFNRDGDGGDYNQEGSLWKKEDKNKDVSSRKKVNELNQKYLNDKWCGVYDDTLSYYKKHLPEELETIERGDANPYPNINPKNKKDKKFDLFFNRKKHLTF